MIRRPGFTLIELIVAVAVLVLLASFAVPTYQLIMAQLQLNSASKEVEDYIRYTQQRTVTEQQIFGVTLTANATTIPQFLYNPGTEEKTTQTTITLPSAIVISSVSFSGNSDIRFSTAGAPNYSGYLVLKDKMRNRYKKIEIKPSGAIVNSQAEY